MIQYILKKLNIRLDENQKWIALSCFVFTSIYSYTSPTFIKEYGMRLPTQFFAVESIVCSLSALMVGMAWQGKLRILSVKWFAYLAVVESVAAFSIAMYLVFVEYNIWLLAVSCLIYTNLISVFVGQCIMTFRTKIWDGEAREIYDNNNRIICNASALIGYGMSLCFLPSVRTSIMLWGITCLLDNIAWCCLYWKKRDDLLIKKSNECP